MSMDAGRRSEDQMALYLGADLTLASGATMGCKSDYTIDWTPDKLRGEHKATTTETLAVKYAWLLKIAEEAKHTARKPVFSMSFVNGAGISKRGGDWVCMRKEDWLEIMQRLVEAEEP